MVLVMSIPQSTKFLLYLTLYRFAMTQKNVVAAFESKLYCYWFGHKLTQLRKISLHFEEYECKNCKKQFTRDSLGKIVTLTPLLKDINETIFSLYLKRNSGKNNL